MSDNEEPIHRDVASDRNGPMRKVIDELRMENANLLAANRDVMLHWEVLRADYERLRAALRESADELDAYYRAEYPGDYPYSQKKLQQAMASNPARAALKEGE